MATQYQLVGGPSKFDLMVALMDRSVSKPRLVKLAYQGVDKIHRVEVSITSVTAEDGSGESWMLSGNVSDGKLTFYKAHYRTDIRQGWIKL